MPKDRQHEAKQQKANQHKAKQREAQQHEADQREADRREADRQEAGRLAALHRYGVLDTADEAAFDRITNLVKRLLDVPIALVTLVDEERQWFKSCVGIEQRETPREVAFCNYNIQSEEVMVVEDATADPRFADNPLVTGPPGIRFYAGAPLVTEGGHALGSLCVIDTEPRSLSAGDRATLETLASVVVDEITMRTHYAREHEILEHIGDGFIALDADWRLTYVNGQAEDALCRGREDLLGQNVWEAFPEAQGTVFEEMFYQVAETGEAAEFEAYFAPLQTWFQVQARPFEQGASPGASPGASQDSSKGPSREGSSREGSSREGSSREGSSRDGLSVYFNDITQQRRRERDLRQTRQLLDSIIESAGVGICVTGADGRFVRVNPAYVDTYGYSREELIGEPFTKVLPPADRAEGMAAHDRFIYDRIDEIPGEWRVQHKDGTLRRVIVTAGRTEQDGEKQDGEGQDGGGQDGEKQDGEPMKVTTVMDVTKRKRAEEVLRRREQYLAVTLNSIADAVIATDPDGYITGMNHEAERLTGWPEAEAEGHALPEVLQIHHCKTGAPAQNPVESALRQDGAVRMGDALILRSQTGESFSIDGSAAPIRTDAGKLLGTVVAFRDVTEAYERQQALHAERDLLENIFNTIAAGVLVVDTDGVIVRANERAAEALGLAPRDVRSRTYNDSDWQITTLEGEPFPDEERPFVRVMETEAPVYDTRYRVHLPNGDQPIASVSGAPLREADGTLAGAVFVITDITEQVETRQQLTRAKEEAESASRLKSAMLANMSHEVRTPLTAIIGFAEILEEELSGPYCQFASRIRSSSQRLLDTLNSVLHLSKLEAGLETPDPSALDLADQLDEVAGTLAPRAEEAGVDLQVEVSERPLRGVWDPDLLYRIVMNLAGNAIKFTEAGGRVQLRATRESNQREEDQRDGDQRTGDHVTIQVEDTGVGISDEFQARLFAAFTQESTGVRREHEGSGLGLAIVDRLVDLLGGTIDVESIKGEGTTFEVVLPAA